MIVLSVSESPGSLGRISPGEVQANGAQQVICTAPSALPKSRVDTATYTITDPDGSVVVGNTASAKPDQEPSVVAHTPQAVVAGQTTVLGAVSPGEPGDTLTTQITLVGVVDLQASAFA